MSLLALSGTNSASGGYEIDNSLKFEADNSEYLSFTNSVGENRRTWTYSTWVKKTELFGAGSVGGTLFGAYLSSNDRARIEQYGDELGIHGKISGTTAINVRTNRVLRDTSAWYHCMVVLDTTQSTETDRVKIYINGVQETSMVSAVYPPQNYQFALNNAVNHFVGQKGDNTDYFCGYMAETYFIDGQALTPTSFGEFDEDSGIWKPKEFSGTYPSADTNHFYLNFDDSSNLGKDSSGNGKNMTSNNITAADQATDTPTNNFCTFLSDGQLFHTAVSDNPTFKQGGTEQIANGGTGWVYAYGTQAASSGKWYWEGKVSSTKNCMIGACPVSTTARTTNFYLGQETNGTVGFQYADGNIFFHTGATEYVNGGVSTNDIIGFAMDLDNGKAYVSRNGTWLNSANPANNTNGLTVSLMTQEPYMFAMARYNPSQNNYFNFGGFPSFTISSAESDANGYGTFEYAPPSGYYALCSKNLAEFG